MKERLCYQAISDRYTERLTTFGGPECYVEVTRLTNITYAYRHVQPTLACDWQVGNLDDVLDYFNKVNVKPPPVHPLVEYKLIAVYTYRQVDQW